MVDAETIARQLGGARKSGDDWSCRCPAHDDKKASLSIGQKRDGKLLVCCHAGCAQSDVIESLKGMGLWASAAKTTPPSQDPVRINLGRGQVVATYDYVDEHGELLYQAVRYEPKSFSQRKPAPGGGWVHKLGDVRRVLYRLPEVIQAVAQGHVVYVVEGEKDVEAARALGLTATCNAMGADNGTGNKWLPQFADVLRGADVVVVPDQDEPGQRHAGWVIETLRGKARNVGRLDVPVGKDLADWIAAGASAGDIEGAIVDAIEVETPPPKAETESLFLSVGELVWNLQPIRWLVEDYFEEDSLSLVFGAPGGGKSFVAVELACCVATGTPWHGHPVAQGAVFYVAGEGHNGLARRFAAWQTHHGVALQGAQLYKSRRAISVFNQDSAQQLHQAVLDIAQVSGQAPKLIILDTVARNFGDGDENSTADMGKFVEHIDTYIRGPFGCNVLLVHHSGHNMDRARGSSALKAALDAEYQVTNEEGLITLSSTKMKDAEIPADLVFRFKYVELGTLEGVEIGSVVLQAQDDTLDFKVGQDSAGEAISAKQVLEALDRGWLPYSALKDALNCTQATAQRAVRKVADKGLLIKDGTGYKLAEKASAALSLTGRNLTRKAVPVWKRGEE